MKRRISIVMVLLASCSNELHGSLSVEAAGKQWSVTPDECYSGERRGFYGVDLLSQQDKSSAIRAILSPTDGPSIRVLEPGTDKDLIFDKTSKCAVLDLQVDRQNSTINNIHNVSGRLNIDCEGPGFKLKSDITFANCH